MGNNFGQALLLTPITRYLKKFNFFSNIVYCCQKAGLKNLKITSESKIHSFL